MTDQKIIEVIERYKKDISELEIYPEQYHHKALINSEEDALAHCLVMIDKIYAFLEEGRREKAFRWLGFIQGVLWLQGIYTLESLKNHSRPD